MNYLLANPFHKYSPCTPVIVSIGVITVLMIEKMAPTSPKIIAIDTDKMVKSHKLKFIKFGLRDISCFTVNGKKNV